jgi:hypothetical protein
MPLIRYTLAVLGVLLFVCLLAASTFPVDSGPFEDEDQ